MAEKNDDRIEFTIEGAHIIWPNFSGRETAFKPAGTRTFNVILDKETADRMVADGWNVKCKLRDEEDAEEFCYLEIAVGYKVRPPKVVCITETSRTNLTEETIGMLDFAEIRNIDFVAQSYHWEVGPKNGIKAYLKTMFVTIEEDALERKYALERD